MLFKFHDNARAMKRSSYESKFLIK